MTLGLRWRLSIMMFFQYMVWGAWQIKLGSYLIHLGFTGAEIGSVFGAFYLACLFSPFVGGQISDRYIPTQIFLAVTMLIGGVLLIWLSNFQEYQSIWWIMFVYALFYVPSLALTNSLSFHHLKNPEKEFGAIRAWGTFGWIAAGLVLTFWWSYVAPFPATWEEIRNMTGEQAAMIADFLATESTLFTLAGIVSIIYGFYCFFLPHTPPARENTNPLAFVTAFKLLKDRNFAFFMLLSFVVSTELMFYYILTPPYLESSTIGIRPENTSAVLTIFGQGVEVLTLFFILPFVLPNWGIRKSLALGIIAWPIRYAIFSLGFPWWLVVLSLTLHGFCYVFFFVVGQIYVDTVAPKDIRASAQSLLTFITFGLGLYFGSHFVGWVQDLFTSADGVINYRGLFLVPTVLTVICAVAFLIFFKEPEKAHLPPEVKHET